MITIQAKNLSKTFGAGQTLVNALVDVNLSVGEEEIAIIKGASGSGKTTLLAIIGCLMKPSSGEVMVAGNNVTHLNNKGQGSIRCNHLSFVFQSFNLIPYISAKKNVQLALGVAGKKGKEGSRRAKEMLELVGLGDKINFLPNELSGGQQQRVAIARALANDTEILLADEPTANLDSKNGQAIMEVFLKLKNELKKSIVVVTHDPRVAKFADRLYIMEDGRLNKN